MTYLSGDSVANRSTLLADSILQEFTSKLARLWIVADPDNVLLDQQVLAGLRERGFDVLPFEDSIAFRAEYEERYRAAWEAGEPFAPSSLVIQVRDSSIAELPWDYLRKARKVSVSLAELFPKLSYTVLRQLGSDILPSLFEAQARHATQVMGEGATKEFVLTHIYRVSPHLITRQEDLWRELLRLHYRETLLPRTLADHIHQVLVDRPVFASSPIAALFSNRSFALRVVQDAWYRYLSKLGLIGRRTAEPVAPGYIPQIEIPFEHHDIRVIVDSMFLDGTLHPLAIQGVPVSLPEWARAGVVQDPAAMRNLVMEGIKSLSEELPVRSSPYRDWTHFARRLGEVISRFHSLDAMRAESLKADMKGLVARADSELQMWVQAHYADLPSLPAAKGPVMVHQVPRYLAMRRSSGEEKIALVVFDGLAVDQWTQIRENLIQYAPRLMFDENACFAWLPTLTSISRQALFSGLRPREFAEHIETTSKEPQHWTRFWQDQGLRANEILYRKAIKRTDELPELQELLSNPALKVAGLVVDTVDEIIHGAVLGKRGVAAQINSWCESRFVDRLFAMLLDQGFHIYLTADHGNAEAVGIGRPNQGVASELRGERVRTYRSETIIAETATAIPDSFRLDIAGLPANFMPLFAGARGAFVPRGDQVVVHGGMSLEELIVPFVKVSYVN